MISNGISIYKVSHYHAMRNTEADVRFLVVTRTCRFLEQIAHGGCPLPEALCAQCPHLLEYALGASKHPFPHILIFEPRPDINFVWSRSWLVKVAIKSTFAPSHSTPISKQIRTTGIDAADAVAVPSCQPLPSHH